MCIYRYMLALSCTRGDFVNDEGWSAAGHTVVGSQKQQCVWCDADDGDDETLLFCSPALRCSCGRR